MGGLRPAASLVASCRPCWCAGESGAGKTEASKKVLQFIAAATGHQPSVEAVKDKLLQSNPVLEAFGNARTNKNNNSSRFGKYMDIAFNFMVRTHTHGTRRGVQTVTFLPRAEIRTALTTISMSAPGSNTTNSSDVFFIPLPVPQGDPVGGNILSYLLEKSRVVHHAPGERNFHIFHQLLAGADDALIERLRLSRDPAQYHYLTNGVCRPSHSVTCTGYRVLAPGAWRCPSCCCPLNSFSLDPQHGQRQDLEVGCDKGDFAAVRRAMSIMELSPDDQDDILAIVASVLHLGNVTFTEVDGVATVERPQIVDTVAKVCDTDLESIAPQMDGLRTKF